MCPHECNRLFVKSPFKLCLPIWACYQTDTPKELGSIWCAMLLFGLRRSNHLEFDLEIKKKRKLQTDRDKNQVLQQIVHKVLFCLIFKFCILFCHYCLIHGPNYFRLMRRCKFCRSHLSDITYLLRINTNVCKKQNKKNETCDLWPMFEQQFLEFGLLHILPKWN